MISKRATGLVTITAATLMAVAANAAGTADELIPVPTDKLVPVNPSIPLSELFTDEKHPNRITCQYPVNDIWVRDGTAAETGYNAAKPFPDLSFANGGLVINRDKTKRISEDGSRTITLHGTHHIKDGFYRQHFTGTVEAEFDIARTQHGTAGMYKEHLIGPNSREERPGSWGIIAGGASRITSMINRIFSAGGTCNAEYKQATADGQSYQYVATAIAGPKPN